MSGNISLQCWLPSLSRFGPASPWRTALARADARLAAAATSLERWCDAFGYRGDALPAAALTREYACHDAGDGIWLSADPAWVQPDMTGARLLACGRMELTADEAEAVAQDLRPMFADLGMQLWATTPDHWHVRLPQGMCAPVLAAPEQAMGEDLFQHVPQGDSGRIWRVLINEVQVSLHQHPLNQQRARRGLPPVNSLWLWGGGALPKQWKAALRGVMSDDPLGVALASFVGIPATPPVAQKVDAAGPGWLLDLQSIPVGELEQVWWPLLQRHLNREPVALIFASGEHALHKPWQRFRFWRKPSPGKRA